MLESKSMFAKRIRKPICWVVMYCKRGIFPTDHRGFVYVDAALRAFQHGRKRGRPRIEYSERIIPVKCWVKNRQKKAIIEIAKELRNN